MKFRNAAKLIIIFIVITIVMIANSCKNPTSPEEKPEPGRRDYVWTVDTLQTANNDLYALWGSSPDNVWLGGDGGITNNDRLWHFAGDKWRPFSQYIAVFPNTIFGFAYNDIWLGGNDGLIYHFNGIKWEKIFQYKPENAQIVDITDIWGEASNDVYAVGVIVFDTKETQRGFILHYDGVAWKEVYRADTFSQFIRIRLESNNIYIWGIKLDYIKSDDENIFYKYENDTLKIIFSKHLSEIKTVNMSMIGDKAYFLVGGNLYRYLNGEFQNVLPISKSTMAYQLDGRSLNDVFIGTKDGIAHYNGNGIEYLYKYENTNTLMRNVPIIFEKDIFYSVRDYSTNTYMVLHGKLKE